MVITIIISGNMIFISVNYDLKRLLFIMPDMFIVVEILKWAYSLSEFCSSPRDILNTKYI